MVSAGGAISGLLAAKEGAVQTQIAFAIAGKQLDAVKQQGDAVVALLEAAAQTGKALGKGGRFDAQA